MSAHESGPKIDSGLLRERILLYLYGELSFAERQEVERLRREDPEFAALFAEEESFLQALGFGSGAEADVNEMLGECRSGLFSSLADTRSTMDSDLLRQRVDLYLYKELGWAERLEVESLRSEDPRFDALFKEQQAFHGLLGEGVADESFESTLETCRDTLFAAVASESAVPAPTGLAAWLRSRARDLAAPLAWRPAVWQPAAAALLLAMGFFGGRQFEPGPRPAPSPVELGPDVTATPVSLTGVEAVRLGPAADHVEIVVEERRVVRGASSDPLIQNMLISTVRESHAGARLTSVDLLREHASREEVRQALLQSMLTDENTGVRLKALEAVKGQVDHPEVREALLKTLREDPVEGMRVHAIQALSKQPGRDLAGPLQELVEVDPNPFVVLQGEQILDSLDASKGSF